jgi:hypothetical protein
LAVVVLSSWFSVAEPLSQVSNEAIDEATNSSGFFEQRGFSIAADIALPRRDHDFSLEL